MDVEDMRKDFVEAVNGVLEKNIDGFNKYADKSRLIALLEILFSVMISLLAIEDKIKGGGK
jgi:hypothetical protein